MFTRRRAPQLLLPIALVGMLLGATAHRAAAEKLTGYFGTCYFSPQTSPNPDLTVTFSPTLTLIAGNGLCETSVGAFPVNLDFTGGGSTTCVGGTEAMSGSISWGTSSSAPPPQSAVSATLGDVGTSIQFVSASLTISITAQWNWVSTQCPGNFSAALDGGLAFTE